MLRPDAVAIITGGAQGLGLAIAKQLKMNNAKVIIFDKDEEALKKLPHEFITYTVDVTDKKIAREAIDEVCHAFGNISILVNNAGILHGRSLINLLSKTDRIHDFDEYKKIIDINMHSVFLMTSLVVDKMIANRSKGVIINISSICAAGNAGQSAYSAAKAGVNAFTKTWAKELGAFGIRVVAIAPGFINTLSTQNVLGETIINDLTKRIPLRHLGQDEHVAQLVLSAITNGYINGAILDVDGGLVI